MRGLLVAAALTLHVVILLPIALSVPKQPPPAPREQIFLVPLDLTETLSRRTAARRPPSPDPDRTRTSPTPRRARTAADPSTAETVSAERAAVTAPPADGGAGQAVTDPWNGRRPVTLALPCPPPPGDRIAARLCMVGPAPAQESDPYDDVGERRLNRSEQAREDGFERQRRANEAWREYTRGEGAYPGLRALRDR
jgi:hypothetical protein